MSLGKAKQCNNNCGQEIAWDNEAGYFVNTNNQNRHDCPNWKKKSAATTTAAPKPNNEDLAVIKNEVASIKKDQSIMMWMLEKISKKIGVEESDE